MLIKQLVPWKNGIDIAERQSAQNHAFESMNTAINAVQLQTGNGKEADVS